jgi:hypothetical protein
MKRFLATIVAIGLWVFLVSPGLAGERSRLVPYGPAGPGGPVQHVIVDFEHHSFMDTVLWPMEPLPVALDRMCQVSRANYVKLSGEIIGDNPLLSDVFCFTSDFSAARVEAVGWINGTLLNGKDILMFGRMSLDIDWTKDPPKMTGYWVFEEGVGTHYGVLQVKGTVNTATGIGSGTYTGWVRENKTPHLSKSGR